MKTVQQIIKEHAELIQLLKDWHEAFLHEDGGTWIALLYEVDERTQAYLTEISK